MVGLSPHLNGGPHPRLSLRNPVFVWILGMCLGEDFSDKFDAIALHLGSAHGEPEDSAVDSFGIDVDVLIAFGH